MSEKRKKPWELHLQASLHPLSSPPSHERHQPGQTEERKERKEGILHQYPELQKHPHYIHLYRYSIYIEVGPTSLDPIKNKIIACLVSKQHEHHVLLCIIVDLSQPSLWRGGSNLHQKPINKVTEGGTSEEKIKEEEKKRRRESTTTLRW